MSKLCKICGEKERWYPVAVSTYETVFERVIKETTFEHALELRKNLGHNLQYLEYLSFSITDLNLSTPIQVQIRKNYIITGISIMEAILYYILKEKNLHKTNVWEEVLRTKSNMVERNGSYFVAENIIYKKIEPKEEEMNLDSMLKKIEKKKILGNNLELYKKLNHFRKLRNQVHIQLVERRSYDWHRFTEENFSAMKEVLYIFFSSEIFSLDEGQLKFFSFLK